MFLPGPLVFGGRRAAGRRHQQVTRYADVVTHLQLAQAGVSWKPYRASAHTIYRAHQTNVTLQGKARRDPSRSFASDDDNNAASSMVQLGLQHTLTNASTTHRLLFGLLAPSSSWARSIRDTLSHTRWSRAGEDGERSALSRWRQWAVRRRMPTWAKATCAARKSSYHSKSLQRMSPPLQK